MRGEKSGRVRPGEGRPSEGENKMGTMPVPRLLLTMAVPMMLSMIVQALYNVVDSLFVSYIPDTAQVLQAGDRAVNALTLAFPIQMLMIALGVGTGVGVNASLSKSLGRGDPEQAGRIAGNAMAVSLCYYGAALLFGLLGARAYLESQTADPVVLEFAFSYLSIVTVCSAGTIGYMCFEKLLQATGKTTAAMAGQLVGSVTNLILDPILIFGLLGAPAMGVTGAAVATVIGQWAAFGVVVFLHFRYNREIPFRPSLLRPRRAVIAEIYRVGGPALLMQSLTSVMTYGMNLILSGVSDTAVIAYGVYFKLQNFIFMPVYGLNNASIPIISFNYGAKQEKRIRQAIRWGLVVASVIMGTGLLLLQCWAGPIVRCFSLSDQAVALCVTALRIITVGFFFAGANITLQGACQALGSGLSSLLISLLRMILVVLPLAWCFSRLAGADTLVWLAFPISEGVGCCAAAALTLRLCRRRLAELRIP